MRKIVMQSIVCSTFLFAFVTFLLLPFQQNVFAQENSGPLAFDQGKWVGFYKPSQSDRALGVTLDVFLTQPNDVREYPRMEAILKFALGGISGPEYHVTHYQNVSYDFSTGNLTFDEPAADFIISAKVVEKGKVTGTVSSSLGGGLGTLELYYVDVQQSDEPCDPGESCAPPPDPVKKVPNGIFLPTLGGIYSGTCNSKPAKLEIAVGRGLKADVGGSDLLKNQLIQARLGLPASECGSDGSVSGFCVARSYTNAQFDFFQSNLSLLSNQFSDSCKYGRNGAISCYIQLNGMTKSCSFLPENRKEKIYFPQKKNFKMNPSAHALYDLPPASSDLEPLRSALEGSFLGYVFHESSGRYQPFQLNASATVSTSNPHNENNIYISGLAKVDVGVGRDAAFSGFKVDRRTFFPAKGMTLRAENSELMLVVDSWKQGYVSGTIYSLSFGRVGPFELVKTPEAFSLPAGLPRQPQLSGKFRGIKNANAQNILPWQFDLRLAAGSGAVDGVIGMGGSATLVAPGAPVPQFGISEGGYGLFDNRISLLVRESETAQRLVVGDFTNADTLLLTISSSAAWGSKMNLGKPLAHSRL